MDSLQLLARLDYIMILLRIPCASGHLAVLPFGIVVTPSLSGLARYCPYGRSTEFTWFAIYITIYRGNLLFYPVKKYVIGLLFNSRYVCWCWHNFFSFLCYVLRYRHGHLYHLFNPILTPKMGCCTMYTVHRIKFPKGTFPNRIRRRWPCPYTI